MFSGVKIGDDLSKNELNDALKKLYETNFFKDVQLKIENSIFKNNCNRKCNNKKC